MWSVCKLHHCTNNCSAMYKRKWSHIPVLFFHAFEGLCTALANNLQKWSMRGVSTRVSFLFTKIPYCFVCFMKTFTSFWAPAYSTFGMVSHLPVHRHVIAHTTSVWSKFWEIYIVLGIHIQRTKYTHDFRRVFQRQRRTLQFQTAAKIWRRSFLDGYVDTMIPQMGMWVTGNATTNGSCLTQNCGPMD